MAFKIAFFDTKPYDRASFDEVNEKYGFEILYHKGQLNRNNVVLTQGMDAICIFGMTRRIPQLLSKWPVTGSN